MSELAAQMAQDCLCFRARYLSRTITRIYDEALRPFDLTSSQLNVLLAVSAFGPAEGTEVAEGLGMEKSTLSRNLTRLVERGLVSSVPSGTGSGRLLSPTDACNELLRELEPAWRDAQARASELLGERQAKALVGMAAPGPKAA